MNILKKIHILYLFLFVLVSPFFFYDLSLKPPHVDESVNGYFINTIWENGFYKYDPNNYHGPLLFYLFQISEKIFGFGIHSFRIVSICFALLTVLIILWNRNVIGTYASFYIGLALGLSPAIIFFSRSAIHESSFMFFQVVWIIGFLKFREEKDKKGFGLLVFGVLGCMLFKETFVILGLAFILAWGWLELSSKLLIKKEVEQPPRLNLKNLNKLFLLKIAFLTVSLWLISFTGFFHHWKGVSDFFVAFMPWLKTGVEGVGHEKPFYYWLELFWRYEWVAMLGVPLALIGAFLSSWKLRFLSSLALINGLIYSVIPYKTPWCIMSILWPFIFVSGLIIELIFMKIRPKSVYVFLLFVAIATVALVHSVRASYTLNFKHYTNPYEPYVYVQTKNDVKILYEIIQKKIQESPNFQNISILINLQDSWPLPWLFSRFPSIKYNFESKVYPAGEDIIFTESLRFSRHIASKYWQFVFEIRDARKPASLYLKKSLFNKSDLAGLNMTDKFYEGNR